MEQLQVKKDQKGKNNSSSVLDEYDKIKEQKTHRTVVLLYKSCCGCGCYETKVERIVPYDSLLQSGDYIKSIERGDKTLR